MSFRNQVADEVVGNPHQFGKALKAAKKNEGASGLLIADSVQRVIRDGQLIACV